jgi:hypothetical protein
MNDHSLVLILKADQLYRNLSEATFNTPSFDFVNSPPDTDVFWDALDLVDNQETCLNFGLSTSSYADSWADGSNTDLLSWSSNSTCLTAPDSTRGSLSGIAPERPHDNASSMITAPVLNDMSFQVEANDILLPVPHTCPMQQYPSLSYPSSSDATSMQQPPGHNEQTLACSEDPFMGWASKRANQMFDEYNWVLSHVETL